MNKIILGVLVAFSISCANTKTIEVTTGSLTYHPFDGNATQRYSNKIGDDGKLIYTPLLGVKTTKESKSSYVSISGFMGQNSIAEPIFGGIISKGIIRGPMYIGFLGGMYTQDNSKFINRRLIPYSMNSRNTGNALVPIIGGEINFKIPLRNQYFMKFNNILTPIITNHNLSVGRSF